jgi:hypothetical protein
MNIGNVYAELAGRLETIPDLKHIFPYPADDVTSPAGVMGYPEQIEYDQTYGRGMDRIRELPVFLVAGRPNAKAAMEKAAAWSSGAGTHSVKAVLESGDYESFDEVTVTACTFGVETIGGTDYVAARFVLDVVGSGN